MILSHYCILDLGCVLGCDPFAINDECGPDPKVQGDEFVGFGGDDSVASPFMFASCAHVAIHSSFGRESFFAVVIVLVGPRRNPKAV